MNLNGGQSGAASAEKKVPAESRSNTIAITASSSSGQQGSSNDDQEATGRASGLDVTPVSDAKQPMKAELPVGAAQEHEIAAQAAATARTAPASDSSPSTKSKTMDDEEPETTPLILNPSSTAVSDGHHQAPKVETNDDYGPGGFSMRGIVRYFAC
jgi:hypothetical protein